jgi:quinol monooxygenase YgiN
MPERMRFARRVLLRTKPDKVDEFVSTMKDKVYPELGRENGIRRVYLLRDAANRNEFVSLTLWDSRTDADAYESTGHYASNRDLVREYLEEDPVVSQFEVEYHTVSPALPPSAAKRTRVRRKTKRTKGPAKRRRS